MARRARILSKREYKSFQRSDPTWNVGKSYEQFREEFYKKRGYSESTVRRLTEPPRKKTPKRKTVKRKVSRETSGITVTDYKDFLPVKIREGLRTGQYTEHQLKLLYKEIYRKQQGRNLALKKEGYGPIKLVKPSELKDKRSIIFEVATAVRRSQSVYATIKGARAQDYKAIASLNRDNEGLNLVTIQDLRDFGVFMTEVRNFMGDVVYDSDRAAAMYDKYRGGKTVSKLFYDYRERLGKKK